MLLKVRVTFENDSRIVVDQGFSQADVLKFAFVKFLKALGEQVVILSNVYNLEVQLVLQYCNSEL